MKRIDVAIGIVCHQNNVLICLRRESDRLGGYWEFPGGKADANEAIEACLKRELLEEVDISIEVVAALPTIEHDYPDIQVRLHPFLCAHIAGDPKALACDEVRWVQPAELRDYHFPPANKDLIESLIEKLTPAQPR
jgi:mutator protein MutT